MDSTAILMKLFGWQDGRREEFERTLATTSLTNLELALMQTAQHPDDDDYDPKIDAWVESYFGSFTVR